MRHVAQKRTPRWGFFLQTLGSKVQKGTSLLGHKLCVLGLKGSQKESQHFEGPL